MYHVIVIGGGHNGLACAAFLAQGGRRVLVVERRGVVGGYCTTEETVAEAPGFLMNPGSLDCILTNIRPSVADQLQLGRYGLRWIDVDPVNTYLAPDGASIAFWKDQSRTVAEIARLSRRDAASYERFCAVSRGALRTMMPYFQGHPRRVAPGALARMLWNGARSRKDLAVAARIAMSSMDQVLQEWFEREEVKCAMAVWGLFAKGLYFEPGTGMHLLFMGGMHDWGVRRPVGGQGAFTRALAAAVTAHHGDVWTGRPVRRVLVRTGRVCGVELEDGTEVHARHVVGALDPTTLFSRLIDPSDVPAEVSRELRGLQVSHTNLASFKADVALTRRLRYARADRGDRELASVTIAPSLDVIYRAVDAAHHGELVEEFPLWVVSPSVFDRTLVPAAGGDSLYIWPQVIPDRLAGGATWEAEGDKHVERCLNVLEDYAPGVKDLVIGARAHTPHSLAEDYGIHKGNYDHVDLTLSQMGPWRPTPSLAGYRTPIDGLWHAGAGAHPFPYIHGMSGRSAAREILRAR